MLAGLEDVVNALRDCRGIDRREFHSGYSVVRMSSHGDGESLDRRVNNSQIVAMGRLRLQGVPVLKIAAATGMDKSTVESWCKRLGLKAARARWAPSCECGGCAKCKNRGKMARYRAKQRG